MKQRQFNKYFNKEKKCTFYFYKIPKYKNKINVNIKELDSYGNIVDIIFSYKKLKRSFRVKDYHTNPHVI